MFGRILTHLPDSPTKAIFNYTGSPGEQIPQKVLGDYSHFWLTLYTVMIHTTLYIRTSNLIIPLLTSINCLFSRNVLHHYANTLRIFMWSITKYTTNPTTYTL